MKIHVTQEDIDKGVPSRANQCPIALAMIRELNLDGASVNPGYIIGYVADEPFGVHYKATMPLRRFMQKFDIDKSRVNPQTFELIPEVL